MRRRLGLDAADPGRDIIVQGAQSGPPFWPPFRPPLTYLALEHSLKGMNAELNFSFIHRLVICDETLAASITTETLYAELRKVLHAKGMPYLTRHPSIKEVPIFSTCFLR